MHLSHTGEVGGVRAALAEGGDPNSRGDLYSGGGRGGTCLTAAASSGHLGVVEELLNHPSIRVNDTDYDTYTALHWACIKGHAGVVRLLVAHPGADLENDASASRRTCWPLRKF